MRLLPLFFSLLSVPLGATVLANKDIGFSANFPEGNGWTAPQEANPQPNIYVWMQKQGPMSTLLIVRTVAQFKGTLDEQYASYRKGIEDKVDSIASAEKTTIGSWPAYRVVGVKKSGDKTYYLTSIMASRGEVIYTIARMGETNPAADLDLSAFLSSMKLGE